MTGSDARHRAGRAARRRRGDGEKSRAAILDEAAKLATVEGIEGLSISRLADAVGMSKSGLFAHFGSKEDLQLAAIEEARQRYVQEVVAPGLAAGSGITRLYALCEAFLSYIERGVFPGGCFFASAMAEFDCKAPGPVRDRIAECQHEWMNTLERAAHDARVLAEVDTRPGAVRDRLVAFLERWLGRLEAAVRDAQAEGAIDPSEDPAQLTFEIEAALFYANAQYVVARDPEPIERARWAIERRLGAAARAR